MCKLVPVITNYGKEVLVADIKKDFINKIILSAEKCNSISKIVLFGSSISEKCSSESDVDFAVYSSEDENSWLLGYDSEKFLEDLYDGSDDFQDIDMIFRQDGINYSSLLYKEIKKGIDIFMR